MRFLTIFTGIGKALSIALSKLGAKVTVLGKNPANLASLKEELPSIETICVDITNWDATRASLQTKIFDLLINNAGVSIPESFMGVTSSSFDLVMSTNVKSVFNVSQIVSENMIKNNIQGGSIVNISSLTAERVMPYAAVYGCSKAALNMLTKVMAVELGAHNIRVNSVNPGGVMTEMTTDGMRALAEKGVNPQALFEDIMKRMPLMANGPAISFEQIVSTVLFVLSSQASATTGQHFVIDNGYMAS